MCVRMSDLLMLGSIIVVLPAGLGCRTLPPWLVLEQYSGAALLTLTDAQGAGISGAHVVATDGEYVTWLLEGYPGQYIGVYRSGTYSISITAAGYTGRTLEGVQITSHETNGEIVMDKTSLDVSLEQAS